MRSVSYSEAMRDSRAYLVLTLDLDEPVEIEAFARVFAGLGGMFDDYLREDHPKMRGTANMYVREVRKGSIIADLVPTIPDMVGYMDNVLIVAGFGAMFSKRVRRLFTGSWLENPSKSQLQHVSDVLTAVAQDRNGKATLEAVEFHEDGEKRDLIITYTSSEALTATRVIEDQKRSLDAKEGADKPRALLVFERPARSIAGAGKRTGEQAVIEDVTAKPLPVIYASEMAEQSIKRAFQAENVFKQGFVVDVNVERRGGKPVAYRIMDLHQIIELPED